MNPSSQSLDICHCCAGMQALTPASVVNEPGLSALVYRVGTHGSFKATMQTALSRYERLRALKTRHDDDPALALIDAWATVLDVLTFYQERMANEGYLRTATERRSVLELARSIGYELDPGVAAGTDLVFELETAPGAPPAVTIAAGTRVQSQPEPDEQPQTFETIESIEARPTWNALRPKRTALHLPTFGDEQLYLQGATLNLTPGAPLLLVGRERAEDVESERWEFRRLVAVQSDAEANRTLVRFDRPLGSVFPPGLPPEQCPTIYALRLRAALFGHNAPAWAALPVALRIGELHPETGQLEAGAYPGRQHTWSDASFPADTDSINLDNVYNQITHHSWLILASPTYVELYHVTSVAEESSADFNITAKTTRLGIAGENIDRFTPRTASVYAQSEAIALAEMPLSEPVWHDAMVLDSVVPGLQPGRKLMVVGKRRRAILPTGSAALSLLSTADPTVSKPWLPGEDVLVLEPPAEVPDNPAQQTWHVLDRSGFEGVVTVALNVVEFAPAAADDATVAEPATLKEAIPDDAAHTKLLLRKPLQHVYDRATVTIHANVARATHGETRQEILGSGDASRVWQHFALKQKPLTFVSAPTPSGTTSTLAVRVNDLLWEEVPSLFGRTAEQQVYTSRLADDGTVTIRFGDGQAGERLPSGSENVRATYRVGTGLAGMVKAGQLSLLMTRPLGVKGASNPLAATGAADPERLSDARHNAPVTVLTLDRIVSLQDYEDFARTFAGIGKAQATWLWDGEQQLVHVTIAAADGTAVDPTSALFGNLQAAMVAAVASPQPFRLATFTPRTFHLAARLFLDRRFIAADVVAAVTAALQEAFSFQQRAFGQPVAQSEVLAVMQAVAGVVAVDLDALFLTGEDQALQPLLVARRAHWDTSALQPYVRPAELLTLHPEGIALGEERA